MKGLLILVFVFASAFAEIDQEIDWDNVKPIEHYPQFWDDKPADLRPPASFFEKVEQERRVNRIVGGQIARPHQFPYQAALLMFLPSIGGNALCGGTIIARQFILTAAHCVDGMTNGTVILGAHFITQNEASQQRFTVGPANIRMDPAWDPSLIRNDVALIRLPSLATINSFVVEAALPTGTQLTETFNAENGVVSGWGVFSDAEGRSSDVLRYVFDNIITNTACAVRFPGVIQASNICVTGTNGRGACSGDSGGPLTVQRGGRSLVIGVVSFGLALGCERSWPSVFARVTSFDAFVRNNMNNWQ